MNTTTVPTLITRLQSEPFAIISAERYDRDARTNAGLTGALQDRLESEGHELYLAHGLYHGAYEVSFLVFGLSEPEALRIARAYDQESILVGQPRRPGLAGNDVAIVYLDGTRDHLQSRPDFIDEGHDEDHTAVAYRGQLHRLRF